MENQIIQVNQAEVIQAYNRAEIDMQIATAKQYPRDINAALKRMENEATMDQETAEDCFYVLRRRGNGGQDNVIEGLSVRMAEIIAKNWGNLRVKSTITGNDGKNITAEAVCFDLETNYAVSKEVKRRITDKNGRTYSEDMQVTTGNAACAIAFRNAVLTVIPKAVTKKVVNNVRMVAMGQTLDLETNRQKMLAYFKGAGVTEEMVLFYLEKKSLDEIGKEDIFQLRATANAIKEGTTTAKEAFIDPYNEAQKEAAAKKKTTTAKDKAAEAMQRASKGNVEAEPQAKTTAPQEPQPTAAEPTPEPKMYNPLYEVVDEETGEVKMVPEEKGGPQP